MSTTHPGITLMNFAGAMGSMSADRAAQRRIEREERQAAELQAYVDARAVGRIRQLLRQLHAENADLSRRLAVQTERACAAEQAILDVRDAARLRRQ